MLAGLRRRVVSRSRRGRNRAPDAGFTLTEVLVSMMLVGVVLGALTTFFVNSMSIMNYQRGKQTAVQLASSGMERVRALQTAELTTTPTGSAAASCPPPQSVAGVAAGLRRWDYDCPSLGIPYSRSWFVGDCWQPVGGGPCTRTAGAVRFLRVVVAVTWHDKICPGTPCAYATSTLINVDPDPVFDPTAKPAPPTVRNPGPQAGEVSVPVSMRIAGSGAPPLTFYATGLPDGLHMDSSGLVTGAPLKEGSYPVSVSATDGFGNTGSTSFTWTVVPLPQLADPGAQATGKGLPVSLQMYLISGTGTGPFTWSVAAPGAWGATGLPPGLRLDGTSGVISGTPTTIGPPKDVAVTVTDAYGKSASVTFTWTVGPAITSPAAHTDRVGTCGIDLQATADPDGTAPYTWSATNLPDGLTMDANGRITGCIAHGTRYLPTITVRDATGAASSLTFEWKLAPAWWDPWGLWRLQVTAPTGDRADAVGQSLGVPLGTNWEWPAGSPTWTATGLPPGVELKNGALTGAPAQAGRYVVRLDVHQHVLVFGDDATFMFTWTVR